MAMDSIDVTGDIMYFSLSDKNILFVKKKYHLLNIFMLDLKHVQAIIFHNFIIYYRDHPWFFMHYHLLSPEEGV